MDLPAITKKEQKVMEKIFKPKPILRNENKLDVLSSLKLTWYFEKFYEKLILSLAMFSLLYSIIRILVQGFW